MINFDSEPKLYLAICNLLLVLSAFLSFYPIISNRTEKQKTYSYLLLSVLVITFIAFRLPVIVFNQALNPDENLFIVGAMTLAQNPIYWESVDGCTSGPFNFYVITSFCELLRQPYDYISARIVGAILMIGNLILNFFTLRKFFSTATAAICIFCVVAVLGTTRHPDFVHFSSEHLPMFLLSIMVYLYASLSYQPVPNKNHLFILGLVGGIIPFTKLQATPIAALVAFIAYWLIYQKKKRHDFSSYGILTFGGLCVPLIFIASGAYYGFLDELWVYYIQNNFNYGNQTSLLNNIFSSFNDPINIFIKTIAVLALCLFSYLVLYKKQFNPTPKSVFMISFVGSSIFAVYKPGFMFHHYLLFLIFPTAFLLGYFLDEFLSLPTISFKTIAVGTGTILLLSSTLVIPMRNPYITAETSKRPLSVSAVGQEILKYCLPDEPLVIWGDEGRHYLEAQRLQGIRWSNSHWGMYNDSLQRLFKQQYVKEFKRTLSPVFIDTHVTTGSFMTRKDCGYETVPELKKLIDEKYQFLTEIDQKRIYIRNDRIAEIKNRKEVTELKTVEAAE
jgi:hypothetical protein